jgi:hypothetical protein
VICVVRLENVLHWGIRAIVFASICFLILSLNFILAGVISFSIDLFYFVGADVVGIELLILVVWIDSILVRWVGSFTLGCGVRSLVSGFWGDLVAASKITRHCFGVMCIHIMACITDRDLTYH